MFALFCLRLLVPVVLLSVLCLLLFVLLLVLLVYCCEFGVCIVNSVVFDRFFCVI